MAIGLAEQRPEKASDALARIRLETERMDRMIGELLTLSRAEQGHGLEQSHYDLLALVETVVQDARFEAQQSGVEIGLEAALGRVASCWGMRSWCAAPWRTWCATPCVSRSRARW